MSPCVNAGWNDAPSIPDFDMDGEGRIYNLIIDTGADECWLPADTVKDAKPVPDGREVDLAGVVVTATFDGFFYIEADDRSCGKGRPGEPSGTRGHQPAFERDR